TLQWWLGHYEVQEAVEREPKDLTLHRLAGIIGQVDEELYRLFVQEKRKANSVTLEYPKQQIAMSPARMRILYFIAGWLLSRIWKHVRRNKVGEVEWMWFVDRH
ncbi:unnamed protein product, partial [Pylaiella littoralis]